MVGCIVLFQAAISDVLPWRRSSSVLSNIRLSMASMSGLLAYAMNICCCSVCRVRVLDLSSLSSAGPFATVHRSFHSVWPCVQRNVIRCLVHCSPVLYLGSSPWSRKKLLLCYAPFLGEIAFDDLVPAQLCGRIWCVWCVRVVGPEPFLDAFYDGVSKVSCSGRVLEVFRELGDELVSPLCSRVTEVQMAYCFGLDASRACSIRGAVLVFPNANR
jgi:hypothetical protein